MAKSRLYIDVDDTLIADSFGCGYDLRPGVITQLKVLSRLFDCYWLTHWPAQYLSNLWKSLYAGKLMTKINYMDWKKVDPEEKAEAVIKGPADFWWLEDTLSTGKMHALKDAGLLDRFIPVDPHGPWGFVKAVRTLFDKAGIGENELSRVDGKIGWFSMALPNVSKFNQLETGTFLSGFITNGKQHCGDCVHRLMKNKEPQPFCLHPVVLADPENVSIRTSVDGVEVVRIDGDRDCCSFINKDQD